MSLPDAKPETYIVVMTRSGVVLALAMCATAAHRTVAQSRATITGIVRDSAARPMANADVVVIPGARRARTDSTGRFTMAGLDAGKYTVRARHMGFIPTEWTVDLSRSGHAEVALVLGTTLPPLDTVFVTAGRSCPPKLEGFGCRRAAGKGVFFDYTDIDDARVIYTADLFRFVDGFGVDVYSTGTGPKRVPGGKRCINTLLNGTPAGPSSVPEDPFDIMAIEIYQSPKDIPKEFSRYTWGKEQCSLIAYWTVDFSVPFRRLRLP